MKNCIFILSSIIFAFLVSCSSTKTSPIEGVEEKFSLTMVNFYSSGSKCQLIRESYVSFLKKLKLKEVKPLLIEQYEGRTPCTVEPGTVAEVTFCQDTAKVTFFKYYTDEQKTVSVLDHEFFHTIKDRDTISCRIIGMEQAHGLTFFKKVEISINLGKTSNGAISGSAFYYTNFTLLEEAAGEVIAEHVDSLRYNQNRLGKENIHNLALKNYLLRVMAEKNVSVEDLVNAQVQNKGEKLLLRLGGEKFKTEIEAAYEKAKEDFRIATLLNE